MKVLFTDQQLCCVYAQVVSAPVIGKVAQVGIERVVGTVIGGWTGYAVYMLGSQVWNETTDGGHSSSANAMIVARPLSCHRGTSNLSIKLSSACQASPCHLQWENCLGETRMPLH